MRRVRVCAASELQPGEIIGVCDGGHPYAVYNVDGHCYATDDTCSHGKASLSDSGRVEGDVVICGWHGGRFSIVDGRALRFPATKPLRTYPVSEENGDLFLELEEQT